MRSGILKEGEAFRVNAFLMMSRSAPFHESTQAPRTSKLAQRSVWFAVLAGESRPRVASASFCRPRAFLATVYHLGLFPQLELSSLSASPWRFGLDKTAAGLSRARQSLCA